MAFAVSSFLFLILASVTGIILSFKPVTEKIQPFKVKDFNKLSIADVIPNLKNNYTDIIEVTVDYNQFVVVDATDLSDNSGKFYINPKTGKNLGKVAKENEFFQWITALHRSLFLHELGRFFIGLTSFLLFLIATSGTVLIIQRQRSFKNFFSKIVKDNFAQYYHVVLGRLLLIPIIIISISGTILSLQTFEIIKEQKISHKVNIDALKTNPEKKTADFEIFKNTKLSSLKSIEFPFSEDVEDYFTLKLEDRELTINQISGEVLTEQRYSNAKLLTALSMDLHTGRTNAIWAIVLAVASANILFFIYSGFAIWWKRRSNQVKNKYKAEQAEYIILVGSENGTTFRFAKAIHQLLSKSGKTSFIGQLNHYKVFPKAKQLIILTATYGIGDAPTNSTKFLKLLDKFRQANHIDFSVVAFGSHAYPDFCKFGYEVNNALSQQNWAKPLLEIHTVNDRSPEDFMKWATLWAQSSNVESTSLSKLLETKPVKLHQFTVVEKKISSHEETSFIVRLKPVKGIKFTSGDLLSIYPANDHRERQYSIGKIGKDVQLSVKLHENGLGSRFLHALEDGQTLNAALLRNEHFHFPLKAKTVIMVSNGTGIAPFLGMINQFGDGRDIHLYCGFRNKVSFELYENALKSDADKLTKLSIALSREGEKQYVKDLLSRDAETIYSALKDGAVIMLCGSLSMQKDVIEWLEALCQKHEGKSVSFYQSHGQVLMDCY